MPSTTSDTRPILAVTMGDPAGIGSEIAVRALAYPEIYDICKPLVIGDKGCIEDAMRMVDSKLKLNIVTDPMDGKYERGSLDLYDLANLPAGELKYKQVTAAQGRCAFEYVKKAIELAMADAVNGTVTGPINKESMNMAGFHYSGHTEIYADLTGTKDYTMMLAEHDFRVVHVSTHVSLREACDRVKTPRVLRVIELADDACKMLGIEKPRIGVCGLNPHCGEARMFGTEDEDEILPAVEQAKAKGILADGPIPADTIFSKMKGGMYDIVVTMYHDQGHIPTKLTGFVYDAKTNTWGTMAGVNITLGLPIIRASVDHGTAFGKAGEGRANEQSLVEAIRYGAQFARGRMAAKAAVSA